MADHLSWLHGELAALHQAGLFRSRREVKPPDDGWCEIAGQRLRDFAANDYLNLARDERLAEAACRAIHEAGTGARASALVTGRTGWHARLEEQLADFENEQAALLFPSGYAANVGTIAALVGSEDVVFCDRLNHASLIDGCRLSGAKLRIYRHNALEKLERHLQAAADLRRRLIVTDSLFSMDGDAAPLEDLCNLADRHAAMLLVDEAHATGVFGDHGRGLVEQKGLEDRVDVRIGTLSKALASLGGFVVGSQVLIDWLLNQARTQMFSTALPPAACAAASAAIEIIRAEPWRREHLHARAEQLRNRLAEANLRMPAEAVGPIVPVIVGEEDRTVQAARFLEEHGFLVAAIRPPTVPRGTVRLRITLSCAHSEADVEKLAALLPQAVDG